jgi:hypothetical protein
VLTHKQIEQLLTNVSAQATALTEYRQATVAWQVTLSPEMAAALGTPQRRLTPFLTTVVEVIANKLEIDDDSLKLAKVADTKTIKQWLGDNNWSIIERELFQAVVRDGKAFILTSWTEQGPKFSVIGAYDGLCGAHVECADDEPQYGWNTWQQDGASYFDLYYVDRVEKYIKSGEKKEWMPRQDEPDEAWPIAWLAEDGSPLGIALTEFCIDNSDIEDALQIGRDMNEALLDMLASSRTQGWPQRYLKGQRHPDVLTNDLGQPIISSTTGRPIRRQVFAAPGSIMLLSDGSEMGQLEPSKADPTVLDKLLEVLSFITTVPTHYFSGQWPSGIALIQAESRLNHKVEAHQGRLSGALAKVVQLAMRLSNYFANTAFDAEQNVVIPWHAPQVETEDLRREREQFQQESVVALVEAKLMSKKVALQTLHPDWSDEQIQEELDRLDAERPTPPPTPLIPPVQPGDIPNG